MLFLGITIFLIPALPILIIFLGISSPQYVIYGTLNLDTSQAVSAWDIYTSFLNNILRFNFGVSTSSGQLVTHEVITALGESFKCILLAFVFSYTIGTLTGVFSVKSARLRKLISKSEFLFYIPMIVFSYLALYLFDFMGIDFSSNIRYFFAGLILSIYPYSIVTKSINKTISEVKNSNFYSFHQSSGFTDQQIWWKFCKGFVIIDYLSFFENLLIFMFGFIFFVETPFGIHGIGYKFVMAIQRFDYPVIIGFCIFSIVFLSIIGILAETIKMWIDPRLINE
jgi:ABC-type dipeptide/oligopeptide/nickel transport system permease component